jgi:hypothetical protein
VSATPPETLHRAPGLCGSRIGNHCSRSKNTSKKFIRIHIHSSKNKSVQHFESSLRSKMKHLSFLAICHFRKYETTSSQKVVNKNKLPLLRWYD